MVQRIDVSASRRRVQRTQIPKESLIVDVGGWLYVGNVSLGTPPQSFALNFDFDTDGLYVLAPSATFDTSDSSSATIADKRAYNASASSSYAPSNASFVVSADYFSGTTATDTLQMGDIQATGVVFNVADTVESEFDEQSQYDGTFGLATADAENRSATLLGQLQPSLDAPLFTVYLNASFGAVDGEASEFSSGWITLGSLAGDRCDSGSWMVLGDPADYSDLNGRVDYDDDDDPSFPITGLSATAPNGSVYSVNANMSLDLSYDFDPPYTTEAVRDLFVQASNATLNDSENAYMLSPDQLAAAQPVYLQLANGGTLRVGPDDYTAVQDGMIYLYIFYKDDLLNPNIHSVPLNMNYLNKRCLSKNFQTGVWSIADVVIPNDDSGSGGNGTDSSSLSRAGRRGRRGH